MIIGGAFDWIMGGYSWLVVRRWCSIRRGELLVGVWHGRIYFPFSLLPSLSVSWAVISLLCLFGMSCCLGTSLLWTEMSNVCMFMEIDINLYNFNMATDIKNYFKSKDTKISIYNLQHMPVNILLNGIIIIKWILRPMHINGSYFAIKIVH